MCSVHSAGPFDFGPDTMEVGFSAEFEWIILESGHGNDTNRVELIVNSNLAFPLEDLNVKVVMQESNLELINTQFEGELLPGYNRVTIDLPTEEMIDGQGLLVISGHSGGSNSPVVIEEDDKTEINVYEYPNNTKQANQDRSEMVRFFRKQPNIKLLFGSNDAHFTNQPKVIH